MAGIGVKRGTAELYPTLRYDEATGQLAADHTNPLQALVYGAIPQAQIGTALLGANSDFKDQMARDPWTAYRSLMAAGGIPLLWRGLNIPQGTGESRSGPREVSQIGVGRGSEVG